MQFNIYDTPLQRDTRPWKLEAYSYVIPVTFKRISSKQAKRGNLTTSNIGDVLHDLLAASFGKRVSIGDIV